MAQKNDYRKGQQEMAKIKKTVLFAEDAPEDRVPAAKYLSRKGYDVVEVFDPKQAIESLKEARFDVVILDLVMPEDNPQGGEEVLRFMKKHRIKTPVILATAWGNNGPALKARAIFPEIVCSILTKTFEPSDLLKTVELAISSSSTL